MSPFLFFFRCFSRAETKSAQKCAGSPSSFKKSLLKRRPLGSFPMKLCTYSVPWSFTAMAYFRGFTQDCRQKGTLESPMVCLRKNRKKTHQNTPKHLQRQKPKVEMMPSGHENPRFITAYQKIMTAQMCVSLFLCRTQNVGKV